jgi:hypothetical protein
VRVRARGRDGGDALDTASASGTNIFFGTTFILNGEDAAEDARDGRGVSRERRVEPGECVRRREVHTACEQSASRLVLGDGVCL